MFVTLLMDGTPRRVEAISSSKSLSFVNVLMIMALISLYLSLLSKNLRILKTYVE